jgi:hypothetical protein
MSSLNNKDNVLSTAISLSSPGTFNGNKTAQGNSDGNGIGDFFYSVPTDHLAICSRNLFE